MNEQRAEFEAWAQGRHLNLAKIDGMYRSPEVTFAFLAYQSAAQRQQERLAYVEKIADDAIELGNQQAKRIAELEAQVQALSVDSERYQFAIDSSIEYGRLNFKAIYDAWDGDGSFTDQIDTAIAAGKGEG